MTRETEIRNELEEKAARREELSERISTKRFEIHELEDDQDKIEDEILDLMEELKKEEDK